MKPRSYTSLAPLAALLLGAFAFGPALSVTPEQKPGGSGYESTSPAQSPETSAAPSQSPSQASEQIMPDKSQDICARYDKNKDGALTWKEFKGSKKSNDTFKSADANSDGRLDMKECASALSKS